MDNNYTPDSWDQPGQAGDGDQNKIDDISNNLSALNVGAAEFVPGRNIHAPAFVPSFSLQTPNDTTNEQSHSDNMDTTNKPDTNGPQVLQDEAPDDWLQESGREESPAGDKEGGPGDGGGGSTPTDQEEEADVNSQEEEEEIVTKPRPKRLASECEKKKEHLNIVFIGHVDAGKSTIGGHMMYLTGQVDKRTLEKYEREAKEKNRETWYLSWALDTNPEERDKGKTVEVGRAYFETDNKFFTILDAPGHRSFVPNMIGGASQADVAVLVISARRGEFETGFERGGQTREHAMLVKTAGVRKLVVVVNKMDDSTVNWDKARYEDIQNKLTPYLKKCGFHPKNDIFYIPVSGLTGYNLKDCNREACSWYDGPSLIDYLDSLPEISREVTGPVRVPIVYRYKDMGTIVLGKVESGSMKKGQVLTMMPNRMTVEVLTLWCDDEESDEALPGENIKIKLKNVEEEDVSPGFVLCSSDNLCHTGSVFDAQVVILEHKSIICAGYRAVMHIHTAAEEVSIKYLLAKVDKKTGEKSKNRPRFIKQEEIAIVRLECLQGIICLEAFKEFPQMGRFTLRDEGKTIAIGKVLKVIQ